MKKLFKKYFFRKSFPHFLEKNIANDFFLYDNYFSSDLVIHKKYFSEFYF